MSKTTVASTGIDLSDTFAFTGTVSGTPQGMVRLNGAEASDGITNITFDGIFTSTYENYRVIGTHTVETDDAETRMVLRKSGSDQADSYRYSYAEVTRTSSSGASSHETAWNNSVIKLTVGSSNQATYSHTAAIDLLVCSPLHATKNTVILSRASFYRNSNTTYYNLLGGIWTVGADGQSNDGFKISASSGDFRNLKYSVYGIKDS